MIICCPRTLPTCPHVPPKTYQTLAERPCKTSQVTSGKPHWLFTVWVPSCTSIPTWFMASRTYSSHRIETCMFKKLMNGETIDQDIFPEDVRAFARNYFKQKKELLFLNSNGVLCVKYPKRNVHFMNALA